MAGACITDYFGGVPDPRAQQAMVLGSFLEAGGPCGPWPDNYQGSGAAGPFQILDWEFPGATVTQAEARTAQGSVAYMAPRYLACAKSTPSTGDAVDDTANIVECAERGGAYSAGRIQTAWQQMEAYMANPGGSDPCGGKKPGDPGYPYGCGCNGGIGAKVAGLEFCPLGSRSPGLPTSGTGPGITGSGQAGIGDLLATIQQPDFWIRAALMAGGGLLVLMGINHLMGGAMPVPVPA